MSDTDYSPVSGAVLPRYAGLASFMRLPYIPEGDPRRAEVDLGFLGMPWDGATSNRPGARHGPRLQQTGRAAWTTRVARCLDHDPSDEPPYGPIAL